MKVVMMNKRAQQRSTSFGLAVCVLVLWASTKAGDVVKNSGSGEKASPKTIERRLGSLHVSAVSW